MRFYQIYYILNPRDVYMGGAMPLPLTVKSKSTKTMSPLPLRVGNVRARPCTTYTIFLYMDLFGVLSDHDPQRNELEAGAVISDHGRWSKALQGGHLSRVRRGPHPSVTVHNSRSYLRRPARPGLILARGPGGTRHPRPVQSTRKYEL